MKHSEKIDKIVPAMAAARRAMGKVFKSGKHTQYSFASFENFIDATEAALEEHGLIVISSAEAFQSSERANTKSGAAQNGCFISVTLRAIHIESCQWIEIQSQGEGQDFGDKAIYKANTGACKYGYRMLFGLATTDEPEADNKTPSDGDAKADKPPRARAAAKPKDVPKADAETRAKIHTDLMDQIAGAKTLDELNKAGKTIARESRLSKAETDSLRGIYEQRAITIKKPVGETAYVQ